MSENENENEIEIENDRAGTRPTPSRTWVPLAVSALLLCGSLALAAWLIAPRWDALWASAVSDGTTRYALGWQGAAASDGLAAGPRGASVDAASVLPGADWVVRPGLRLTAPDHSLRIDLQETTGEEAAVEWERATAEGFGSEQVETLGTGAVWRSLSREGDLFGVLEGACPNAHETVVTVAVEDFSAPARVALGQLLESVCASSQ